MVALTRLADVAALEHFTAVLGQSVLTNRGLDYARTAPMMLDLLRWHADKPRCTVVSNMLRHTLACFDTRSPGAMSDKYARTPTPPSLIERADIELSMLQVPR